MGFLKRAIGRPLDEPTPAGRVILDPAAKRDRSLIVRHLLEQPYVTATKPVQLANAGSETASTLRLNHANSRIATLHEGGKVITTDSPRES